MIQAASASPRAGKAGPDRMIDASGARTARQHAPRPDRVADAAGDAATSDHAPRSACMLLASRASTRGDHALVLDRMSHAPGTLAGRGHALE